MILKEYLFVTALCVVWFGRIEAVSYSKVFVQQGGNLSPTGFINYGSPAAVQVDDNQVAQIAQLSAAPLGSVVPLTDVANFTHCVTPCVVKSPKLTPITNAKLLAYNPPNVPALIVAKPNEDPVNYQYSYVVYDENTGDQKAQTELSDGGVVRGEYSFMQPDGYIREVTYTADDVKGFNAVVKKFLPEDADKKTDGDTKSNPPCDQIKSGALQETPITEAPKVDAPTSKEVEVAKVEEVTSRSEEQTPEATTLSSLDDDTSVEVTATTPTQPTSSETTKSVEIVTPENTSSLTEDTSSSQESGTNVVQNLPNFGNILKCLQATAVNGNGLNGSLSPIFYVLLPNKRC